MDRRTLLKAAAGVGTLALSPKLAAPALAQGAAARTLRFVPQADLANFDPIWGTQYVVRNAAALVWDTLYGVDEKLVPQRQMVESEEVSADGLTWTFRLPPGSNSTTARGCWRRTWWRASIAGQRATRWGCSSSRSSRSSALRTTAP
jgi:ABC-type transport system substrate-binding protein